MQKHNMPDTQQMQPLPVTDKSRVSSTGFNLDIKELLALMVSKWYWFVISLVVTVGLAVLFIKSTPPIYQSTATLMTQNSESDQSTVDLTSLGIRDRRMNLANELLTIESTALVEEVVKRLGLNNIYTTKDGLREINLYKHTPILVTPADTINRPQYSFKIKLDGHKNFELSDFSIADNTTVVKGSLGQTVKTPLGYFTISASPWYNGNPYIANTITFSHQPSEVVAKWISPNVCAFNHEEGSSGFVLYVSDISKERSYDIVKELIEVYRAKIAADQTLAAVSTCDFINKRLAILEEDLGNVDSDISSYKSSNLLPDVGMSSSMYFGQAFNNKSSMLDLNSEISMAQFIRRELLNAGIETPLPVNTGLTADGIQGQITEYNTLVMERNRLMSAGNESNPVIGELTTTIGTLKHNMVRSLDNYITALHHQLGNLNTVDSKASSELSANPNREKYLLSVERQQKVKEQLYMFLLQKREESELSQAYIKDRVRVLEEPSSKAMPIAPDENRILLIAFVIGLGAPILILFLRETLNSTIRGRRDLGMMTLPFVGEIPYGPGRKPQLQFLHHMRSAEASDVIVEEGTSNVINEAFRAIRTSLEFMTPDNSGEGRLMSFTSACTGSGKTFIVMNLATALALSGKKVCVIDLDMRKAVLSKWGGHIDRGVSNYLIGQLPLDDIIIKDVDRHKNIDLIPVGVIPPNPVELLSHNRLKLLFDVLRQRYDYILVDCPPAEVVADARIVSKYADMTIFIIRAGMFEKSMLADLEEYAETGRYHNLAVILNGTDPRSMYSRKRYGYGYGYGYSYGYGYTKKK